MQYRWCAVRSIATGGLLDQYVNDRPYAMSSFMTVAMGRALGTAFTGRSKERQAVADAPLPLEIVLTPLPVRGAEDLPTRLFAPLGYTVQVEKHAYCRISQSGAIAIMSP